MVRDIIIIFIVRHCSILSCALASGLVCQQDYTEKTTGNIFERMGRGPREDPSNFGAELFTFSPISQGIIRGSWWGEQIRLRTDLWYLHTSKHHCTSNAVWQERQQLSEIWILTRISRRFGRCTMTDKPANRPNTYIYTYVFISLSS